MMRYELDRVYASDTWVLRTSGVHGIVTPSAPGAPPPAGAKPPTEKMSTSIDRWMSMAGQERDCASLRKLAALPDCDACKGKRSIQCRRCNGTGRVWRECEHCDDRPHQCICDNCDNGRILCRECGSLRLIVIDGHAFNAQLVDDVLSGLGVDGPALVAVSVDRDGYTATFVVHAVGAVGIAMAMRASDEARAKAAVWS